ncbi:MAG: response regulator transcription factor [Bacteroidetes bacterium]|nr:response regulator transcription factor [Bacteroidota bacterium]MBS1775551.1 response regulator transcription factor [Bacteroidota bacterium]
MMPTLPIRIAIADDHTILRQGLRQVFQHFEDIKVVLEAANGAELIEKLSQMTELPHVVIMDINMPVMDGFETASHLKQHWNEIKILALSMHDHEEVIIKMLRCGAHGYLLKDTDPKDIHAAVHHLRDHEFYCSDLITGRLLHRMQHPEDEPIKLTDREKEFLAHSCTELTYREIAEKMFVSPRTVDGYRENLFDKLNITTRVGLAIFAIKSGLVKL